MARNMAECRCCGGEFFTSDMVRTSMPNRGGNSAYMCYDCATRNRYYHTSNNEIQGVAKVNAVGVGHEFEISNHDDYARNILFEFGMIPTNDSSLRGNRTCEFVTGIQQGLNISSKMAVTIENLMQNGHIEINYSCGTHFHVSINSMKDKHGEKTYMEYIRRFYHSIFVPLAKKIEEDEEKAVRVFGRYFTDHIDEYGDYQRGYAAKIDFNSDASNRYNFINVKNDSNIEFRLNKFVSAKQYQTLTKMEVDMVKCIVTNFCEHFNDDYAEIDASRYYKKKHYERTGIKVASKDAYRKHKADVTANKLVKLYEKYTANL